MHAALKAIAGLAAGAPTPTERFPWHTMTYRETGGVRAALLDCCYAPATVNRMLTALRGVLREVWLLGLMPSETLHRAIAVRNVKASTLPRGRTVGQDELAAVFAVCARDSRAAGRRDAAAIAVLVGCGLRRAEAASLDLAHVDVDTGLVVVHGGKGRKDRAVYLPPGARAAVRAWLDLRGSSPGPLLWAVEGGRGAGLAGERLSPHALYAILKRRASEAGVAAFAPHDLRRTFVSELLERTGDLALASELAGHSDPRTTKRYDLRGAETKRRACGLLEVPFLMGGKES
jgi:integrase